jgi:hypothetical protein
VNRSAECWVARGKDGDDRTSGICPQPDRAKAIVRDVGNSVAHWRETAAATSLNAKEIERRATA